jgi:hypothetical protein
VAPLISLLYNWALLIVRTRGQYLSFLSKHVPEIVDETESHGCPWTTQHHDSIKSDLLPQALQDQ